MKRTATDPRVQRVAAFVPYPSSAPSVRFRVAQFREPLRARGIEVELLPFMEEAEYRQVYRREVGILRKVWLLFRGMRRRLEEVRKIQDDQLALVHRELAPIGDGRMLAALRHRHIPLVFDFDDAVFLPPRGGDPWLALFRRPRQATVRRIRSSRLVLAGNAFLAAFAREVLGSLTLLEVLPTVLDTSHYTPGRSGVEQHHGLPIVGWIGTYTTLPYLEALYDALRTAAQTVPFHLVVVSNQPPRPPTGVSYEFRPWSQERELEDLRSFQVGLYPLPDDPWTRGKCGFKALQYMACGVPVLASPVGVLKEIVTHAVTGFHAEEPGEWVQGLATLLRDADLRRRLADAGRQRVVERYSLTAVLPRLEELLRGAFGR